MTKLVLDASAALEAVLPGRKADGVLDALSDATVVIAPDLYGVEVANALWKYVKVGELSEDEASERLDEALALTDVFVESLDLLHEAFHEATVADHPVYDLCYAVTARRHGSAVLTIDRRLSSLLDAMSIPRITI